MKHPSEKTFGLEVQRLLKKLLMGGVQGTAGGELWGFQRFLFSTNVVCTVSQTSVSM